MMEPKEKKAFEPSGLVPRSIVRTFERFRQQLLPGSETAAIREYRISRYQVLVSARCLFTLLTIPIATNWLVSSWLLSPLIEHFWNTQQNEIFLNSYQEERAFAELEFFSEKLFFESLLNNAGFTESPTSDAASYFLPRRVCNCTTDNSNNLFNSTIASNFTKTVIFPLQGKTKSPRFENFALKNELSTKTIGSFSLGSFGRREIANPVLLPKKGQEIACAFGRGRVIGCAKNQVLHSFSFGRKAKLYKELIERFHFSGGVANLSSSTGVTTHTLRPLESKALRPLQTRGLHEEQVNRILVNLNPRFAKARHNLSTTCKASLCTINQQNIPSLSFRNFFSKKDPLPIIEENKVLLGNKSFPLKDDGKEAEMPTDLVSLIDPPTSCTFEIFTSLAPILQDINKPSLIALSEKKLGFYSDIVFQKRLQSDALPICNNRKLPGFHSLLKETVGDKQMFNSRSCIEEDSPFQLYKFHKNNKLEFHYFYPTYEQAERRRRPEISLVSLPIDFFQNQSWNTPEGDKSFLLLSMDKKIKESTALTPAKKLEVEGCYTVPFYEKSINSLRSKASNVQSLALQKRAFCPSFGVQSIALQEEDNLIRFLKALFSDLQLNFHNSLKETDLYIDSINVSDNDKYLKKNTGETSAINPIQLFFRGPSISKPIYFEKKLQGKSINSNVSLQSSTSSCLPHFGVCTLEGVQSVALQEGAFCPSYGVQSVALQEEDNSKENKELSFLSVGRTESKALSSVGRTSFATTEDFLRLTCKARPKDSDSQRKNM